jgi:hypothetical protein
MEKSTVKTINISSDITVVGKTFMGDYAKSPQFVTEVQASTNNQQIHQ